MTIYLSRYDTLYRWAFNLSPSIKGSGDVHRSLTSAGTHTSLLAFITPRRRLFVVDLTLLQALLEIIGSMAATCQGQELWTNA